MMKLLNRYCDVVVTQMGNGNTFAIINSVSVGMETGRSEVSKVALSDSQCIKGAQGQKQARTKGGYWG